MLENSIPLMSRHAIPTLCLGIFLCLFLGLGEALGQSGAVRGFVTDKSDGQALLGVNVALDGGDGDLVGAVTDGDGIFIIARLEVKTYIVRASYIGYDTYVDTLEVGADANLRLNIELVPSALNLDELVVEAEREAGAANVVAGLQSVRSADIDMVPSPDVSGDLVNYLTAMPGMVTSGDRGGQLFVRGGEPAHNLTIMDGMIIYQPFHILGFYSAFPSESLQQADIYAGGYGSKYSGRLSSVIDVQTRNGNKKEYGSTLSLAPFVSMAMIEGPVFKNKMSFMAIGRASTIDRFAAKYIDQPLNYKFGDVYAKTHVNLTETHQVSASILYTYDQGSVDPEKPLEADQIRWNNFAMGMRYLVLPSILPMRAEVLFSVSRLDTELGPSGDPSRSSKVDGFNAEFNASTYSAGKYQVDWGFFIRSPNLTAELGGLYQNLDTNFARSSNAGAYFEPEINITERLRVRAGGVIQIVGDQGVTIEPRGKIFYDLGRHKFSAAGGVYHQNVVGLSDRRDATNIFTAWAESPNEELPRAVHGLVGYQSSLNDWLDISIEGFFKDLKNLYISEWTPFPTFSTALQQADGTAKGIDLRMEVRKPKYYFFLNYGLSAVRYQAKQDNLQFWFGESEFDFRPPHDRRHQINFLGSTNWKGIEFSVRWNFGSGLPFNQVRAFDGFILVDGEVDLSQDPGQERVIYDSPYGGILPTYHRLDFNMEKSFFIEGGSKITLNGGILNGYDRQNLFSLDIFTLRRVDQLPFVPTLGMKWEF